MISLVFLFLIICRAHTLSSSDLANPKVNAIVKIVDASLQEAQRKVQVPHDDPQILKFIKEFRKDSIETLVFYHDQILKASSKSESEALKVVNIAVKELYSKIPRILHSSSIFKRTGYFGIIWMLLKQMFYVMIISIVAMILVNIPKSRIRKWYCLEHPCENEDDDLIYASNDDELDFDNLKGSSDFK